MSEDFEANPSAQRLQVERAIRPGSGQPLHVLERLDEFPDEGSTRVPIGVCGGVCGGCAGVERCVEQRCPCLHVDDGGSVWLSLYIHIDRSQNSPRSPDLIEIYISFKLYEVDSFDLRDSLRAVYVGLFHNYCNFVRFLQNVAKLEKLAES